MKQYCLELICCVGTRDPHPRQPRLPVDMRPDAAARAAIKKTITSKSDGQTASYPIGNKGHATDVKETRQSSNNVDAARGTSDTSYRVSTTHKAPNPVETIFVNIPSGDLSASELSDASDGAIRDNQNDDLNRDLSGRSSGSPRSFGNVDTSGGSVNVISGPSSHHSSSRLQYDATETKAIQVAGARTSYIDPRVPLANGIGQGVEPNEDSYKAAASSDDVVSDHSDNSGDATGEEEDLYSNVSAEDRQTLQNLAFDMDVYATNVAKLEAQEGHERDVTDVGAEVPKERDGGHAGDKSAEPGDVAEDENQTDVVDGDSQKSAQQTTYVPEETIPTDRDEVKAADHTELRTGKLFFTYIVN